MDPLPLLRELVAIDSVNPSLVRGAAGEAEVVACLRRVFEQAGVAVTVTEAAPGRPNLVAAVEGRAPGRTLVFCGHTDTVGVEGMAAPFDPVERAGCLYGRGAQDMKGGVAAMCAAALTLAGTGLERGRVVVAAVADEEYASAGAEALVKDLRADGAVVTEPTDLEIATAHKGFAWITVRTKGVAAHGSRPAEGRDAIMDLGRVLARLEALGRVLAGRPAEPRLGPPSLHLSTVRGGGEWSVYPDWAEVDLERRTVPGEDGRLALLEVEEILAGLRSEDPAFDGVAELVFSRAAYQIDARAEVPQMLEASLRAIGRPARFGAMSYWTDAGVLGHAGIPTVLFGPGGGGLHGLDEHVRLDEVVACRDALVDLARRFC